MSKHYDYYGETWEKHDGKEVTIDGYKYILRVSVYNAVYPYEHKAISVYADPKNKDCKYYQDVKRELGDDWSTDVLDSDPELSGHILNQLEK